MTSFFTWLDTHPTIYWLGGAAATAALLVQAIRGLRPTATAAQTREWLSGLLLLVFLLAWRWPGLLNASEYNPDESQFIAGALTLRDDPVFWRSVDGVTSGPLDFYALLPLNLLGVPLDYFGARLTALLLGWITLVFLQRLFRSLAPPGVALLAVLPGAVFLAAATAPDFVHYSSELVPVALLALAVGWVVRRPLAAAFVAGCLPWAKLQAAPFAAVLTLWLLWQAWQKARAAGGRPWARLAAIAGSAVAPSLCVLGALAVFGQLEHFFRRYVLQNVTYVSEGMPLGAMLQDLHRFAGESGHFIPWLAATGLCLLVSGGGYLGRRQKPPQLFWLGALLTLTAVGCVLAPARASLHYTFFLLVPLVLWTGTALADLWSRLPAQRAALAGLVLACAFTPLGVRLTQPAPAMFGFFAEHWRHPFTPLGQVLRHWQQPGTRLALWGWMNSAYVESGLPQATRDTVSQWCIFDLPQRDYYRATYLADMERNRPELFVDAVGPGSPFINDRATQAHEIFPALADYIRAHYQLVIDLQHARVYARTDFIAQHPLPLLELQQRVARGRVQYSDPVAPARVEPASAPKSQVRGDEVQMVEPATELSWPLDGTERAVRVNFGFHPKAFLEGQTDGAEFLVELRMPGQAPLQVIRRPLNPQKFPDDRLPLAAEADLPPYPPGTTLVVRSSPGPAGNSAWDWVYLDQLRFARSAFYTPKQFPGFRRLPDRLDAAYPYLVRVEPDWLLMLPPPATLTFVLGGKERQFNFSYGLAEGSYTGAGQSDGAVYEVEWQRDGVAPQIIFSRHLAPLARAEDRGRQSADLMLPGDIQPGDRIVLRLGAGGNDSWDWTYLSALDLR